MKKEIISVVGTNLLIILGVSLLSSMGGLEAIGIVGGLIALILTPINAILSIVHFNKKNTERGKAYLLATGLCLLIGFALCSTVKLNIH